MKGGTQAAVAVGIGYMLGRKRKMRRAAIVAALAATGSAGVLSKALLGRGLKALGSTELLGKLAPELGEIADMARTELVDAGKTAAMGLVTNRVESLSDSLRSRADVLKDPAAAGGGVVEVLKGGGGGKRSESDGDGDNRRSQRDDRDEDQEDRGSRSRQDDRAEDQYEDDEAEDNGYEDEDAYDDEDYEPEEPEEDDEYEGDDEGEPDEDEPAPAPRRRTRVTSSPVSRAGR